MYTKTCWHAGASKGFAIEQADWLSALLAYDSYQHVSVVQLNRFPIAVICSNIMGITSLALSVCKSERESGLQLNFWCYQNQSSPLVQRL